ncbi:phage minor capsid protein [uncultured Aeromicrobium sp.]|uniref:phage minor capsid protein n=1 Tax=uncultured Aeromicrobium sp. TaxID=337820 RepID=UPI0025F8BA09|nr:phage minor capsid protein [uncultured Aeromicrobium sp.]
MPIGPEYAENLAAPIAALYADAERILLERIAKALAAEMDAPDWAERKLIQLQLLQAQNAGLLRELSGRSAEEIATAILKAYNRGTAMAVADMAGLVTDPARAAALTPGVPAVEAMVTEAVAGVASTHGRILRASEDVFRQVIARTAPQVLLGTQTRRQAAQAALDEFASRGITGFVDSRGRQWEMASYVEMSTRAATANAAVTGHSDRLLASGIDTVRVSDAPQECSKCRPWEGKVLSLSGVTRADGVRVAGTLAEAKAAGLMHPGCRHTVSAYLHGYSQAAPSRTADPEGDAARQRLRYLERKVREWKRREAVALTPEAGEAARAKVRAYQAAIREHVASTPVKRQRQREQLGRAR